MPPAEPAASPPPLGFRELLGMAPMRRLWLAQIVSVLGDFLALFAVLTHVSFELRASAAEVTGISIAFMLPFALVGPLAGVFVDRWDVRRTMIASDLVRAAIVLALVWAPGLWQIYALLFVLSTVSTFFVPAQSVAVRALVPPHGLMAANALLQQAMQLARIVGPALAGALVGWLGAASCYLLDAASYLASAALVAALVVHREPARREPGSHPVRAVVDDLGAGVRFLAGDAVLRFAVVAMAAGMFAVSCFAPLVAVYVRDVLRSSPLVYGVVNAMIGVGMLAGTLIVRRLAARLSQGELVVVGLAGMALFVLLMAAVPAVPAAALGMFGVGVGVVFVFVSATTAMQGRTPVPLVGRVSASVWALLSVAQLAGLVLSGSSAGWAGVVPLFYASAALLALLAAAGWRAMPRPAASGASAAG